MKATRYARATLIAKRLGPLVLALTVSGYAHATLVATPVSYGTWLFASTPTQTNQAQFTQPSDSLSQSFGAGGQVELAADLSNGELKALNANSILSPTGAGTDALFYDTLTFVGTFSNRPQDFTVNYDGTWGQPTGAFDSTYGPFASGLVEVMNGSTTVDSSDFNSISSAASFLTGTSNNCLSTPSSGTGLSTSSSQAVSYSVTCHATLNGTNPVLHLFANLSTGVTPDANTAGATWSLDMTHTAKLDVNFNGLTVYSASGVLPGTQKAPSAPVPEPGELALMASGLLALVGVRKRTVGKPI